MLSFQALSFNIENKGRNSNGNCDTEISSFTSSTVVLFVCVEVLQPSQPNGVMSSAVSLPNHMFTGQA